MAYATGNGTFDAMLTALVTFAKANAGFSSPASPGTKQYWRIVMSSYALSLESVWLLSLAFRGPGGSAIGAPTTVLTNSEDPSFPASNLFTGGGTYRSLEGVDRAWVGGFWSTPVEINGLTVGYANDTSGRDPVDITLEYSDDGVTWQALTTFSTDGNYLGGGTYDLDPNAFSLTPGDNFIMGITKYQNTTANEAARVRYFEGGGSTTFYPTWVFFPWGKRNFSTMRRDDQETLRFPIPADETVSEWHFFADTSVSNHFHCVFATSDSGNVHWHHFSMGFIDNAGMSHHGVAYVVVNGQYFYIPDIDFQNAYIHQSLLNGNPFFSTIEFGVDNEVNASQWYFADSGGSGYPVADNGSWPARNTPHGCNSWLPLPTNVANPRFEEGSNAIDVYASTDAGGGWDCMALNADVHPISGFISLGTIPVACRTSAATQGELVAFLGQMPNMRFCRMDGLAAGDEITVGADTWKIFPRIRKTTIAEMDDLYVVGSGPAAYAYKKVP